MNITIVDCFIIATNFPLKILPQFFVKIPDNTIDNHLFKGEFTMNLDKIFMIPFLSKELNLIGHPALPYTLKKRCKNKNSKTLNNEQSEYNSLKVIFDSKEMIEALVSVCFELLKQVKVLDYNSHETDIDKINFENAKLERQLKSMKVDLEKKLDELAAKEQKNRQLMERIEKLEEELKNYKIDREKLMKKNLRSEDMLKHNLKKKNSDLEELHKIIWKQFNMADQNYFPENFEIIKLDQPNFSKLWSEERYSSGKNKEEVLKKAVCTYQENNNILMENNTMLKNLLLISLQGIQDVIEIMFQKIELDKSLFFKNTVNEVFKDIEVVNIPLYKEVLSKYVDIMKKIFSLIEESIFHVGDDSFLCWSDILKTAIHLTN